MAYLDFLVDNFFPLYMSKCSLGNYW